ncbi:MAG: hypothetical protein RKO24_08815, partial [Candidatus Competibacter sp.]|nr:hypothetical protein [Candidatus Competibacter sp.]
AFDEQRNAAAQAVSEAEQSRDIAIAEQRQARSAARDLRRELESTQAAARELADRLLVEQERRAAAEAAIQAAEQHVRAAMDTVAQIRAETTARIAQTETVLEQTRADMAKQLTEARQRFEAERQRGEAGEARLLAMLDQIRAEQQAERQAFTTERRDWNHQETLWREQHEARQRETAELRATLTAAGERQNALTDELGQFRRLLRDAEARHLETVREAEGLRGELKVVQQDRIRLQHQLETLLAPSSDPVRTRTSD